MGLSTFNLKKTTVKQVFIIVISIFIGWILLTVAYSIPLSNINNNIENSAKYFKDSYPRVTSSGSSQLDLVSDAVMLLTSGYRTTHPTFIESLLNNRIEYAGKGPAETLYQSYNKNRELKKIFNDNIDIISYARYWHGYSFILKLLLSCPGIHYGHIRSINMVIQLGLFALLCVGVSKLHKTELIPILVICWIFMNPLCTIMCLQYSTCTIITFAALNYIIFYLSKDKENVPFCGIFFTCIGIITSFLDLLSFPLVTLGVPLLIYTYISEEKNNISLFCSIKKYFSLAGHGF